MTDSRLNSVLALQEILEKKIFLTEALEHHDSQDGEGRAFQNMLLLTCLRKLTFLRQLLKSYSRKKLPQSSAIALYALYLGMVELLYMETPAYAVINSYVNLVKKRLNKYVAGFVNAVLRKISEDKENILKQDNGTFFPQGFVGLLRHSYDRKTILEIEKASNHAPDLDITAKNPSSELAEKLGGYLLPTGNIRLKNSGSVSSLYGYKEGLWWVQDFAAALPVKTMKNLQNKRVLDLCAAPGGKTAQLINSGAKVTSLDISAARLKTLQENLQRLNFKADKIICQNALEYLENFKDEPFDAVLLDAPCSATGTLRRHPELVHLKSIDDISRQSEIQKQLLQKIAPTLKKGGVLIYCVCSLCKEEGENQIKKFLEENPNFQKISLSECIPEEIKEIITPEGFIRILPSHLSKFGGADGFFIAQLEKVAD